jgi:NAD(P)-dependent dehydrogenase (short-subunit alcohol dehydrogenase family)
MPTVSSRTILLIGASRGLGHAMAAEVLKAGWNVVGTVGAPGLHYVDYLGRTVPW